MCLLFTSVNFLTVCSVSDDSCHWNQLKTGEHQKPLDLQFFAISFQSSNQKKQTGYPLLLADVPDYLLHKVPPPAPTHRHRHRGKRAGRLVKFKAWLIFSSAAAPAGYGPFRHIPRRLLDPVISCLVTVVGLGVHNPAHHCFLHCGSHGINFLNLLPLTWASPTTSTQAPAPMKMALTNAWSLANKASL